MDSLGDEQSREGATDRWNEWNEYASMEELKDLDYWNWRVWKCRFECVSILLKAKFVLEEEDQPDDPTVTSSPEEKAKYREWEESDCSLRFLMKGKTSDSIFSSMAVKSGFGNAKQMLAALEESVMEKARFEAPETLRQLLGMRYNGQGNVRGHLLKMKRLVDTLSAVGVVLPEYLINQLSLGSLPSTFNHTASILSKPKCDWYELLRNCAVYEEFYIRPRNEKDSEKNNEDRQGDGENRRRNNVRCYSCGL